MEFPFDLSIINQEVPGMSRGNYIIFARPEVGKTTFCSHLCLLCQTEKACGLLGQ